VIRREMRRPYAINILRGRSISVQTKALPHRAAPPDWQNEPNLQPSRFDQLGDVPRVGCLPTSSHSAFRHHAPVGVELLLRLRRRALSCGLRRSNASSANRSWATWRQRVASYRLSRSSA
jgi:hypothetical protein